MNENIAEKLTKSEDRVKKYGEVFTPQWVANDMLDMLEKNNPSVFEPATTFLEPTCGEGVFILEILRRKFAHCKKRSDYTIALESVYGFEIQADNVQITIDNVIALCEEWFKPTKAERQLINDHIIQCDSLKVMKLLQVYGDNPPKQVNIFNKGQ